MKRYAIQQLCLLICLCLFSCKPKQNEIPPVDLPQIKERGELVALTVNGSASYFNYRGEPMGFQYELAQQFARSLGLKLRIQVVKDEAELIDSLLRGKGDLIAYNLPITNPLKDSLIFCGEENITRQVIVQRKGKQALKDVTQLIGKEIYTTPGIFHERLKNLNSELGGGINIHEVPTDTATAEDLITWVSEETIDYTVATDEIARINRTYYPNLDISMAISFDQRSAWAVRKTSPLLAEAADQWHKENIGSAEFKASARRYFELNKRPSYGPILSVRKGKISHYDDLFRKYAKQIGWDWRLLASLAYTESNFNPDVVSWAGARGLMQLMPATARALGVPPGKEKDPEESIKAAVKYIASMQRSFERIEEKEDQTKFILAAYNAGIGHVTDAMALAEKYGRNQYLWEHNVAHFILLKSEKTYYQDPVCKNGYLRGTDTYRFVKEITDRAEYYKKKIRR